LVRFDIVAFEMKVNPALNIHRHTVVRVGQVFRLEPEIE